MCSEQSLLRADAARLGIFMYYLIITYSQPADAERQWHTAVKARAGRLSAFPAWYD